MRKYDPHDPNGTKRNAGENDSSVTGTSVESIRRRTWLQVLGGIPLFGGSLSNSMETVDLDSIRGISFDGTPLQMGGDSVPVSGGQFETADLGIGDVLTASADQTVHTYTLAADRPASVAFDGEGTVALFGSSGRLLDMASSQTNDVLTVPADTSAFLQVTAAGTSPGPYSLSVARTTATTSIVPIEAESAADGPNFAPLEVRSATAASGGEYVVAPDEGEDNYDGPPPDGHATYTVDLPNDDRYTIWVRAYGQNNGNTYYGRVDDGDWHEVHVDIGTWNWRRLGDSGWRDQSGGTTFPLSNGTHTIEMAYREDGCWLDRLVVTNDDDYVPTGKGPNGGNQPPSAALTASSTTVGTDEPVRFDGSASSDPDGTIASYEWAFGDGTTATGETVSHEYDAAGDYKVTLTVRDDHGATDTTSTVVTVGSSEQAPYGGTPADVTEGVEAENFDTGGQSVAYNDTTAENIGGLYRTSESVDVETRTDDYNVGWTENGEWLEYTVAVPGGTYDVTARVASKDSGGTIRVLLDGTPLGTIDVPVTGSWSDWTTVTLSGVSVSGGDERLLRLEVVDGGFNLDWVVFEPASDDGNAGPSVSVDGPASLDPGESGTYTATGSDPDGDPLSYQWSVDGAPAGTGTELTTSFENTGNHTVTATVTDDDGTSASDSVTVTVTTSDTGGRVSGTLREYHRVTVSFDGPSTAVGANDPHPFLDYRLDVTFTGPSGQTYTVPGFYAGDGEGGSSGSTWRARFSPDESGDWTYEASFWQGDDVAVSNSPSNDGSRTSFDGASGTFTVGTTDKNVPDLRARGRIANRGDHYFTDASGDVFVSSGPNIPENFLGYEYFSNMPEASKTYAAHQSDWRSGDPKINGDKGIVGALNFIADRGSSSVYFLPMNLGGDAEDTYPFPDPGQKTRYDPQKLREWETVFAHAESRGILLHVVLSEHETNNQKFFDNGAVGPQRRLFFRELVARFGHHAGVIWNIGEEAENTFDDADREAMAKALKRLDPYGSPIAVHNWNDPEDEFDNFLGDGTLDTAAMQNLSSKSTAGNIPEAIDDWRNWSASAGQPWTVCLTEPQKIENNDSEIDGKPYGRKEKMWPAFAGGAAGFEWYIQEDGGGHKLDQNIEDFNEIEGPIRWSGVAREILENQTPGSLLGMGYGGSVSGTSGEYLEPNDGNGYWVVYLPEGGSGSIDAANGDLSVTWFDPTTGKQVGTDDASNGSFPAPPTSDDAVGIIS